MYDGLILGNITGSDPGYDEASGPRVPYDFFGNEVAYIPIDEIAEEDNPLRFVVSGSESLEDCERRVTFADMDDPLAYGETEQEVLDALGPFITVDIDDYVPMGPAKTACRRFNTQEILPATPGIRAVPIKKFSQKTRKWERILTHVIVSVRKTRTLH